MSPESIDLARRLVALPEWEWWEGMHAVLPTGEGPQVVTPDAPALEDPWSGCGRGRAVPDLDDPATAGCLLARASRLGAVTLEGDDGLGWTARIAPRWPGHPRQGGATPGEALARAILAALESR